jgi:outer membrane lipoprotein-sorting protein
MAPSMPQRGVLGGLSPRLARARRLRWAVPVGAVVVAGGVIGASLVSSAQATPPLPPRTPAQLLAAVAGRTGPLQPLTGTVVETAALGLPDLPGVGDPTSLQSLITGSHTIRIWYADPQHVRLAIPGQLSETDVIRNGQDLWMWSSVHNTVTHQLLPAGDAATPVPSPVQTPLTPQQAAQQALAAVGPTTSVSVASNVMVADEPAYELVLAPKDSRSLIGQVRIAIDAAHNVPLRVQVFARGSSAPAFQTGFTSIAFTSPAAANFKFTPPSGATVVQGNILAGGYLGPRAIALRSGTAVAIRGDKVMKIQRGMPGTVIRIQRGVPVAIKGGVPVAIKGGVPVAIKRGKPVPAGVPGAVAATAGGGSTVVGKGWLAVAVVRTGSQAAGSPAVGGQGNPQIGAAIDALRGASSEVHGTWGSGRLLQTKLVSVLLTSDGRLLIGAVTPDVLYSAAAQTSKLAGQAGR